MKKYLLFFLLMLTLVFPNFAEARGFSGHSSFSHSSFSHSSSFGLRSSSTGTYHSGYKSPSSNVTRNTQSSSSSYQSRPSRTKSLLTHAAAFGAGAFFGSMFHPFGGHYYGGSHGFSMLGFLGDILVIAVIIWLIKKIFVRRRY